MNSAFTKDKEVGMCMKKRFFNIMLSIIELLVLYIIFDIIHRYTFNSKVLCCIIAVTIVMFVDRLINSTAIGKKISNWLNTKKDR